MRRPVFYNRYLPSLVHRIANALCGGLLLATIGVAIVTFLLPGPWQWMATRLILWTGLIVGTTLLTVSPKRLTLVEGVAGEMG